MELNGGQSDYLKKYSKCPENDSEFHSHFIKYLQSTHQNLSSSSYLNLTKFTFNLVSLFLDMEANLQFALLYILTEIKHLHPNKRDFCHFTYFVHIKFIVHLVICQILYCILNIILMLSSTVCSLVGHIDQHILQRTIKTSTMGLENPDDFFFKSIKKVL